LYKIGPTVTDLVSQDFHLYAHSMSLLLFTALAYLGTMRRE